MSNKRLIIYGIVTLVCGVFSIIYEHFSHGVYSNFMVYLFAIPFALGVLPELIGIIAPRLCIANAWAKLLQYFAIATLTIGSALQGVVEIYGTTNDTIVYYFVVGSGLLILCACMWAATLLLARRSGTYL